MSMSVRHAAPARRAPPWRTWFILMGLVFFALLAGLGTAVVGPLAAVAAIAMVGGAFAFFLPLRWLVILLFVVSFVITGQVIYFARFDKALWFPFVVGALMMVRYPVDRMLGARPDTAMNRPMPLLSVALLVYFLTATASAAINQIGPLQLLVSGKEYIFLWSLYLVLVARLVPVALVKSIWLALPWLVVAQLPIIFYQRFVVAPRREAQALGAAWDAVAGAFGGNPDGGGSSGAMGIFCTWVVVTTFWNLRAGVLKRGHAALLIGSAMLCLGLAEVKFAILLLPVGFAVVFSHEMLKRPLRGLGMLLLAFVLSLGVLAAYKAQYDRDSKQETLSEYFEGMFASSADANFVNLQTREIGRVAAIRFWATQHSLDQPMQLIMGHGIGSSRIGQLVVGEAARKWPFNIARSALAILLWEVGLLGTAALCLALAAAAARAYRLMVWPGIGPDEQALAAGCGVAIVFTACSLPYNTDLMFAHQTQLMLLLSLGTLAMLSRSPVAVSRSSLSPEMAYKTS